MNLKLRNYFSDVLIALSNLATNALRTSAVSLRSFSSGFVFAEMVCSSLMWWGA